MVAHEKRQDFPSDNLTQSMDLEVNFQDDMFEEFEATDANDDFVDDESHDLEPTISL